MHTSETSSKNVGVCRSDRTVDQWCHSIISLAFAVEWPTSRSVTSNIMSSMRPVHFQRSIDIAWSVVNHIGLTVQSQIINKEMPNCKMNRLSVTLGKQILVLNPYTWMNVSRNILLIIQFKKNRTRGRRRCGGCRTGMYQPPFPKWWCVTRFRKFIYLGCSNVDDPRTKFHNAELGLSFLFFHVEIASETFNFTFENTQWAASHIYYNARIKHAPRLSRLVNKRWACGPLPPSRPLCLR